MANSECFRAISITTRIETFFEFNDDFSVFHALELYPLQLGLKLCIRGDTWRGGRVL